MTDSDTRPEFSRTDANRALELAYHLAARAIIELNRPPLRAEAALEVGHVLTLVEAGGAAYEAGDAKGSKDALDGALRATAGARASANAGAATAAPRRRPDPAIDLLDQAARALERAVHRISNTSSSHIVFGAIETPRSERLP